MNVHDQLKRYICVELLQEPDYPLEDNEALFSSGLLDSLSFVDILLFIDATFGITIPGDYLNIRAMNSLDQITRLIEGQLRHSIASKT